MRNYSGNLMKLMSCLHQDGFSSSSEEYNYWQDRLIQLTYDKAEFRRMDRADADCNAELRHFHYTLKLFRLLHCPVRVNAAIFSKPN